jgi:hypothetical protein
MRALTTKLNQKSDTRVRSCNTGIPTDTAFPSCFHFIHFVQRKLNMCKKNRRAETKYDI